MFTNYTPLFRVRVRVRVRVRNRAELGSGLGLDLGLELSLGLKLGLGSGTGLEFWLYIVRGIILQSYQIFLEAAKKISKLLSFCL